MMNKGAVNMSGQKSIWDVYVEGKRFEKEMRDNRMSVGQALFTLSVFGFALIGFVTVCVKIAKVVL